MTPRVVTVPVPASEETLDLLREGDPAARAVLVDSALHAASTTRPVGPGVHYATQSVLSWALRFTEATEPPEVDYALTGLHQAVADYQEALRVEQQESDARYDAERGIGAPGDDAA